MIRIALTVFALLSLTACHARAQEGPSAALGCYGDLGASGTSTTIDKETTRTIKQIGGGAGCNMPAGTFILGGGVRVDTGSGGRSTSVTGKLGIPVNSGLLAYGLTSYTMDADTRIDVKNGILAAGVGIEIALSKGVAGYVELTRDLARMGTARDLNDQTTAKAGVRIYLGK